MTSSAVRQVPLPPEARALSTLSRIDYADAFIVEVSHAEHLTGEQWARLILENTPITTLASLLCGWSALGLKLGSPRAHRRVLGWELRQSDDEFALLGAGSRIGMPAELLFAPGRDTLLFATLIQHRNPIARAIWAPVIPRHQHVVRGLLERGARSQTLVVV